MKKRRNRTSAGNNATEAIFHQLEQDEIDAAAQSSSKVFEENRSHAKPRWPSTRERVPEKSP